MTSSRSPVVVGLACLAVLGLACNGDTSGDSAKDASGEVITLRADQVLPDGGCEGCGVPCERESDCGPGLVCGYKIGADEACVAQGVCVPRWPLIGNAACGALSELCGCDGTIVVAGCNFAPGYAPAPTFTGNVAACSDGGTPDAGAEACGGFGASCGTCCEGLTCSPAGANASLPGSCVRP